MEQNKPTTGKFSWTYGLINAAIGIAFSLMIYMAGMIYDQNALIQYIIPYTILTVVIILAIIQFKKANQNILNISQGLKLGAGIALVGAICGLLYFFILSNYIEPEYMDKMYEIGKQKALMDNPKLTEEQVDQGIEMQKKFSWMAYPVILILNTIIGLVIGLVGGLIFQKSEAAY